MNVISPGSIHTAGAAASLANSQQALDYVTGMVQVGRIGEGIDIGKSLFLASDDSSFIAGVELFIDGGVNAV